MTPSPTTTNALRQLGTFLRGVLPAGVEIVVGQVNRVAAPRVGSYVVMTPFRVERLRTNVDDSADCKFTGSIAGAVMTVASVDPDLDAPIRVGSVVFGTGVAAGTVVTALGTGTGGAGTYQVGPAQNVSSRTMSAGRENIEQGAQVVVQMDFHASDPALEGDMALTASTLLRDAYAVRAFAEQVPNYGVVPLHADDARQTPFLNENQQVEWRWIVEARLQANVAVSVPQQYADDATVEVISVDATYPP